jgi:histidinol phosphatase-like PHP family hydrolase
MEPQHPQPRNAAPCRPAFPRTDWHTHASLYRLEDPREEASLEAMIGRAAELGLDMLGIGEHVNAQPKHPLACYAQLAHDLRRMSSPLPVFLGAEVDILGPDGRLSVPEGLLERIRPDYLIASVHSLPEYTSLDGYLSQYQRLMIGAITADNGAHILGHPWHNAPRLSEKGLVREWRFALVPEGYLVELIDALRSYGMAWEVNSRCIGAFAEPAYRAFVARLRESGIPVAVGSDAHTPARLDTALAINAFLADMGFDRAQVWLPPRARELLSGRGA